MPICFKPGKVFPVVLAGDAGDEHPATFYVRAMTCAETMEFSDVFDKLRGLTSGREAIKTICDALRTVLVNVEGLPVPYEPDRLEHILSLQEAKELVQVCIAGRLSESDVKK